MTLHDYIVYGLVYTCMDYPDHFPWGGAYRLDKRHPWDRSGSRECQVRYQDIMSHSKLQLEVLKLYREFLKVSKGNKAAQELIKSTFKVNSQISQTNFFHIEHLIRSGHRKLQVLKSSEKITFMS